MSKEENMNITHIPCANTRTTGCTGYVGQRGNIFCMECMELRKNQLKMKREVDVDELAQKNVMLERQLSMLKKEKDGKEILNSYKEHTEKELSFLTESLEKLRRENELYIQEKNECSLTLQQCKIDNESLKLDNDRLGVLLKSLEDENKVLKNELQKISNAIKASTNSPYTRDGRRLDRLSTSSGTNSPLPNVERKLSGLGNRSLSTTPTGKE